MVPGEKKEATATFYTAMNKTGTVDKAVKQLQKHIDNLLPSTDMTKLNIKGNKTELIKSGKFARVVRLLMDDGFEFGEAVKEAMRQGYNSGGITSLNRENLNSGTMPKSEKWMREYFFDGKGGYDDRMSYKEFALGPGQELYKKFGND